MNIVFVSSHLTVFVGYGKFLRDYANKFSELGHNITIVAQKINQNNYKFNKNIELIEIGGPILSSPLFWINFHNIKKKYVKVLNKIDCDLFISLNFPSNYFCASMEKKKGQKHVFYCQEPYRFFHDNDFYSHAPWNLKIISGILRFFFKKFDIIGARSTDNIISISDFIRKRVKEWYGMNSDVHYIGVKNTNNIRKDIKKFNLHQKLNIKDNIPIIFALGYTHHLKGVKELLLIFKEVLKENPNIILLIGGWIKEENQKLMKKYIKKLNIPQRNLIFYGFIEDSLLDLFYANSTLTFYTPIDEAFGLIPVESMRNGTPVIAFEGGPSETIIDGQTGYVIKKRDIRDFSQKALLLLKNKTLYDKFSEKGIEIVKNNFYYDKCIPHLESLLQEIISKG
ncbi:MAG: glycosyltransferase family 4 protein [Promethearchaeota archaeon]